MRGICNKLSQVLEPPHLYVQVDDVYLKEDMIDLYHRDLDNLENIMYEEIRDVCYERRMTMGKDVGYSLSDAQKKFIRKAKREGFEVDFTYSGRGMFGKQCPAVICNAGEFGFKGAAHDQMGKGVVIYMPR